MREAATVYEHLMRQLLAGAITLLIALPAATPADARRGGGNDHFNSPGYQRALAESRKAYRLQIERQRAYEQHRARKRPPRAVRP